MTQIKFGLQKNNVWLSWYFEDEEEMFDILVPFSSGEWTCQTIYEELQKFCLPCSDKFLCNDQYVFEVYFFRVLSQPSIKVTKHQDKSKEEYKDRFVRWNKLRKELYEYSQHAPLSTY
jgi:hypothetical protein